MARIPVDRLGGGVQYLCCAVQHLRRSNGRALAFAEHHEIDMRIGEHLCWAGIDMRAAHNDRARRIYGLGQGLQGLFEPGQGINFLWLAVTGVAMFVLFAQMGRVHDTWPRRRSGEVQQKTSEETALEPPVTN